MKLSDLIAAINRYVGSSDNKEDREVAIILSSPSMGGVAKTIVKSASFGFDWDRGYLLLSPSQDLSLKTENEDIYDSARELLMYLATKPMKRPTYEVRMARRIFDRMGYDYMKYQKIFHKDIN